MAKSPAKPRMRKTPKAMVQSGKRDTKGRTEAPEVLLVNQPAEVPGLFGE